MVELKNGKAVSFFPYNTCRQFSNFLVFILLSMCYFFQAYLCSSADTAGHIAATAGYKTQVLINNYSGALCAVYFPLSAQRNLNIIR